MEGWYSVPTGKDERVFPYFRIEREMLASLPTGSRILDLGCSEGAHFARLSSGGTVFGVDVSLPRLVEARKLAPVAAGTGAALPFADDVYDFVYVSHVLHHAADHRAVLREIRRVLRPNGAALVVETCDDSPMMRLARRLRPEWDSDPVRSRFRFAQLVGDIHTLGFRIERAGQFNVLYWMWAFARSKVRPLGRLLEPVIRLEMAAAKRFGRYSAYGYVVARKE